MGHLQVDSLEATVEESVFSSYLQNRTQSVVLGPERSAEQTLIRGVPQGSVLGPLLFTLYTTPLSQLLSHSSVQFHLYADDTQLYISFSSSNSPQSLERLSTTLDKIYSWFCTNRLSINPSKTEYLLIGTSQQRSKVINSSVNFQNLALSPSDSA